MAMSNETETTAAIAPFRTPMEINGETFFMNYYKSNQCLLLLNTATALPVSD